RNTVFPTLLLAVLIPRQPLVPPPPLGHRVLWGDTRAPGNTPGDTGQPLDRPVHMKFLAHGERLPLGVHGIQGGTRWGRSTRPPRGHVRGHEMFDGVERLTVCTNELLARLCPAAPGDALEGRPVGEQAPEPVPEAEGGLDDNWARSCGKSRPEAIVVP